MISYALCRNRDQTYTTEDNTLPNSQQVVNLQQDIILGFIIRTVHEELLDSFHAELFLFQSDLIGVRGKLLRKGNDLVRERGREQERLSVWWEHSRNKVEDASVRDNFVDRIVRCPLSYSQRLITQTLQIHHLIRLIKHQHLDILDRQHPLRNHIHDRSRRPHHDLGIDSGIPVP